MIEFWLPILPCAKQSMRFTRTGHRYQPADVKQSERDMAALMAQHRPEHPLRGPLILRLDFEYAWLKGHSRKVRAGGTLPKDTKPDMTNLVKNIEDVLERMGFVENDAQFCDHFITRRYTDHGPRTWVCIQEFDKDAPAP